MSRYNDMTPEDLRDYQPVKERIRLLYQNFPNARIVTEIVKAEKFEAIFKASIYRDDRDQRDGLPLSTGYAQEFQEMDDPFTSASWFEVSETSAIGRALRNASIGDLEKPSFEEMQKPLRHSAKQSKPASRPAFKPTPQRPMEKTYPKTVTVAGPKVAGSDNFEFKKLRPKLSEDQIRNYVIPQGVHKGKYLDQIEYAELIEYSNFIQSMNKKSHWANDFLNVAEQFIQQGKD